MSTEPQTIEAQLGVLRRSFETVIATAHCSAEGFLLSFDGEPGFDESILGDIVASASTLSSDVGTIVGKVSPTVMVSSAQGAIAMRQLTDGTWVSIVVSDGAALGRAAFELAELEEPSKTS